MQNQVATAPTLQNVLAPGRLERTAQRAIRDYLYAAQQLPWRLTVVPRRFHPAEQQRVAGFAGAATESFQRLEQSLPARAALTLARLGVQRGKRNPFEPAPE
jgi:hypothetical protein